MLPFKTFIKCKTGKVYLPVLTFKRIILMATGRHIFAGCMICVVVYTFGIIHIKQAHVVAGNRWKCNYAIYNWNMVSCE